MKFSRASSLLFLNNLWMLEAVILCSRAWAHKALLVRVLSSRSAISTSFKICHIVIELVLRQPVAGIAMDFETEDVPQLAVTSRQGYEIGSTVGLVVGVGVIGVK